MTETETTVATADVLDRSTFRASRQAILKVETPAGPIVVKRYGRKRGALRQACIHLGHWTFAGKSLASPRGRMHNEAACLALWREHGFDVFEQPDVDLEVAEPHLVVEYVEGATLYDRLGDPAVSEAQKVEWLTRFAPQWCRRHQTALRLREPRLLHEHGTFRHVFVAGERLITFDFEISWVRRGPVPYLIGREVASFVRSLARASESAAFAARLEALVHAYGDRQLLAESVRRVARSSHPVRRIAYAMKRLRDGADPQGMHRNFEALRRAGLGGA